MNQWRQTTTKNMAIQNRNEIHEQTKSSVKRLGKILKLEKSDFPPGFTFPSKKEIKNLNLKKKSGSFGGEDGRTDILLKN